MLKVHEFILTFFYCGKFPKASGTFGSAVSLLFWLCFTIIFCGLEIPLFTQNIFWTIFLILSFSYGCIASPLYAKQFGNVDHGSIVLDEVVGQVIALQMSFVFLYQNYFGQTQLILSHLLMCFVLFRFFDIKKPSVIGCADRNFKNGFGVMFDDLLSGILAGLITLIFFKLTLMIR